MQIATIFITVENSKQTNSFNKETSRITQRSIIYLPPGSTIHGILHARKLQSVAISSSRGLPYSGINFRWLSFPNCQIVFIKFCLPSLFKRKNVTEDHANMYKAIGVLSTKRTLWNIDDPSALLLSQGIFHLCALTQYYIWKDKFSL